MLVMTQGPPYNYNIVLMRFTMMVYNLHNTSEYVYSTDYSIRPIGSSTLKVINMELSWFCCWKSQTNGSGSGGATATAATKIDARLVRCHVLEMKHLTTLHWDMFLETRHALLMSTMKPLI